MKTLPAFLKALGITGFLDEKKLLLLAGMWYSLDEPVRRALQDIPLPPLAAGLCLGAFAGTPKPSNDLLHLLAKHPKTKKAVVGEKGAWMFVCKKPVLRASILQNNADKGEMVFVLNEHGECLGFGVFDGKNIKNGYDIGDYLRRERS